MNVILPSYELKIARLANLIVIAGVVIYVG